MLSDEESEGQEVQSARVPKVAPRSPPREASSDSDSEDNQPLTQLRRRPVQKRRRTSERPQGRRCPAASAGAGPSEVKSAPLELDLTMDDSMDEEATPLWPAPGDRSPLSRVTGPFYPRYLRRSNGKQYSSCSKAMREVVANAVCYSNLFCRSCRSRKGSNVKMYGKDLCELVAAEHLREYGDRAHPVVWVGSREWSFEEYNSKLQELARGKNKNAI